MRRRGRELFWVGSLALLCASTAWANVSAREILRRALATDPWGLAGAEITAHVTRYKGTRVLQRLSYTLRSRRHDPLNVKLLIRITAPADVAGTGLLLIQHQHRDDDRFIFFPQARRARRVSVDDDFLGTGFSFADLDRYYMRSGEPVLLGQGWLERIPCHRLDLALRRSGSPYSHVEVWVGQETYLPLRLVFYDRQRRPHKALAARELQRVQGRWFVTKARLTSLTDQRSADLVVLRVVPRDDIADHEFTLRALEKL